MIKFIVPINETICIAGSSNDEDYETFFNRTDFFSLKFLCGRLEVSADNRQCISSGDAVDFVSVGLFLA